MNPAKPAGATGDPAADITLHYEQVIRIIAQRGLLLGAYDSAGRANAMTIGWGAAGRAWGLPVWTVLVRPSRYTYDCIEHSGAFTVCVPPAALAKACQVCGRDSGRDKDKLAELGLSASRGRAVNAPLLEACPINYECRVVQAHDMDPDRLEAGLRDTFYDGGNFHRVYWGKVEAIHFAPDAASRLA